MISDLDIYRAAQVILKRYGVKGAAFEAAARADEYLEKGQLDGSLVNGALLDSSLSDGGLTLGRYFFQVRNGVVVPPSSDVPEPVTTALFALGLAGLAVVRRKRMG